MSCSKNETFKGQNPAEETSELQNIRPTARNSISVNHMFFKHIAGISLWSIGFNPKTVQVGYVVDRVALVQGLPSKYFGIRVSTFPTCATLNHSFIHSSLVPKSKKEYYYISTPPLCLPGMLQDDLYLITDAI
jgi:hypothetical protein